MRVWCLAQCRVFVVWNASDAFDLSIRLAWAASLFSLVHSIVIAKYQGNRSRRPLPLPPLLSLSLFHTHTLFRHENHRPSVTPKSKSELNFDQSNCWLYVFVSVCVCFSPKVIRMEVGDGQEEAGSRQGEWTYVLVKWLCHHNGLWCNVISIDFLFLVYMIGCRWIGCPWQQMLPIYFIKAQPTDVFGSFSIPLLPWQPHPIPFPLMPLTFHFDISLCNRHQLIP